MSDSVEPPSGMEVVIGGMLRSDGLYGMRRPLTMRIPWGASSKRANSRVFQRDVASDPGAASHSCLTEIHAFCASLLAWVFSPNSTFYLPHTLIPLGDEISHEQ